MMKIHERGLQSRESRIFLVKKPGCIGTMNKFSSVSLMDITGAIYVIILGFIGSFFGMVFEIILNKIMRKRSVDHHGHKRGWSPAFEYDKTLVTDVAF